MRWFVAWLSSALLLGCASSPDAGPAAEDGDQRAAQVDGWMQGYAGAGPGAAVLVLKEGRPLLRRGYGMAEMDAGARVTPQTNFRLASISKQFTAAAIVLLAQQGRLGLDDPIRTWFPTLPPAAGPITVRHLLTHSSGLVDYETLMSATAVEQIHDIDVLHLLEQQPRLYFTPGTQYRYSNGGYAVLALLVGKASGQDYASFLKTRIFQPLKMDGSVAFEQGRSTVTQRAYGYTARPGHWVKTDQSSTSAVLGDGGVYSSIDDLAKWDAALHEATLFTPVWRDAMITAHVPVRTEADVDGYGYGWRVHGQMVWHSGETIGFRNVIVRWPSQRLTVVMLTNRDAPEPYRLARRIAALYQHGP